MHKHNLLNEFADLSQRLEHLVSYSSQMVFISGEQMGDQKKFVEAFLGARQDSLDVIYLTGNSFHNVDDVRQEFARQVIGNTPSLDLPLLQLVATRENRDKPLLIAITRAERIPDQILQELWDLVLQTRFARNQQQINILLFGEHEWAERTKAWLPTNNNDKPVLLTSETVEMQSEQEVEGDLDAFINAKRKEFNERLKARSQEYEPPSSVLGNWWVRLVAVCAFIICFSGILIWQYFDLTQSAVKDFTQFLFQSESASPSQEWEEAKALLAETETLVAEDATVDGTQSPVSQETQAEAAPAETGSRFVTSWKAESAKLERRSIPLDLQEAPQPAQVEKRVSNSSQPERFNTQSGGIELSESESIVDISPEQLKKLQPKHAEVIAQTNENTTNIQPSAPQESKAQQQLAQNQPETNSSAEPTVITEPLIPNELASQMNKRGVTGEEFVGPPIPAHLSRNTKPSDTALVQNTLAEQDTSVPSQLSDSAEIANSAPQTLSVDNDQPTAIATNEVNEGIVADYPVDDIVSVDDLVAANTASQATEPAPTPTYEFNEASLLTLSDTSHLLQVSGMSSRDVLNQYLQDNRLTDKVWIYKTRRYGGDWFVVLFNKAFDNLNSARASVGELPQTTRQSAPFAKSAATIQQEIEQGYPTN